MNEIQKIEKMEINDNDVIIISSKKHLIMSELKILQEKLLTKAKNILLINCSDGMKIERADEEQMNKCGWFRKGK